MQAKNKNKEFLKQLLKSVKPYEGKVKWGLTASAIASGLDAIGPLLLKYGIDNLQQNIALSMLILFAGLIVTTAAISGYFRFVMRDRVISVSRFVEMDLRGKYFLHLLSLAPIQFDKNHTGDLMARATEDVERVRMVLGPALIYAVGTALTMIVASIFMFILDVTLASIVMLLAPLIAVSIYFVSKTMHKANYKQQETYGKLTTCVQENLSGMRVIKAFSLEDHEADKFEMLCKDYYKRSLEVAHIQAVFMPLLGVLIGMGTAGILWWGGIKIINDSITLGSFIAFMSYLSLMTWPMIALGWITHIYQRAVASNDRLNEIFEIPTQFGVKGTDLNEYLPESIVSTKAPTIEFKNVQLQYLSDDKPALNGVNLSIPAGMLTVIVGRVGSGKSSIVRTLTRLYEPQSGEILIDDKRWDEMDVNELRSKIGFVDQTPFMFSASILDNLLLGNPNATEADVDSACHTANFEDVVDTFPDRYDTLIGERGVTLSGGQQQRLTLARAILRNPPILVLDDALSAVDADTESVILSRLGSRIHGRTTIMITHRLAVAEKAKHIVVVEKGNIIESGSHAELLQHQGIYAGMYQHQRLREEIGTI